MSVDDKWPIITKYYFCCSLDVGIFSYGVIFIIFGFVMLTIDTWVLIEVMKLCNWGIWNRPLAPHLLDDGVCRTVGFTTLNVNFAVHSMLQVALEFGSLVAYVLLLSGILMKKPCLLKAYLHFNIPCWIYMTAITALNVITLNSIIRILTLLIRLFDGYNILAVQSSYRVMTGLSKFHIETDSEVTSATTDDAASGDSTPPCIEGGTSGTTPELEKHCGSCTCETRTAVPRPAGQILQINIRKEILLAPREVLLDPRDIANMPVDKQGALGLELASQDREDVPDKQEKNCDIDDLPVIYDSSQLDVGTSSILENVDLARDMII